MKDEARQTIEAIASHPKTAVLVTGMLNVNVWYANYEPLAKFISTAIGIALALVLLIKHTVELYRSFKTKKEP